ncbi:MFS transporter [Rariglobus hedericola]|nr:MFS transporter [Rariglobus hedericola]
MSQPADQAPVKKSEIFGWCCFDFANSAFTTIIITAVYFVYFQKVVMSGAAEASTWWGVALAVSQLGAIIVSPFIGALADVQASKKKFLMATAIVCSLATASLYFVGPGEPLLALVLVVLANFAFSLSETLCAGFLPEISTPQNAGRISGYGWSFGYFGGLLSLVLALLIIKSGEGRVPWTFVMTGVFFMLASLPTLLLVRERARPRTLAPGRTLFAEAWGANLRSLRELPSHRTLAAFLVSLMFSTAGLVAVVAFAGGYADGVLKMTPEEFIKLLVVLQLSGVAGAYGFGLLQDRAGPKFALSLSLILWIFVCVAGAYCSSKLQFYGIGALAGIAMGALQSAGRAVVSTLTPEGRGGEFFGFWGFFTKLAGVIGQPVFGVLATHFGFRTAILVNAGFFVVGLVILLPLSLTPSVAVARNET